MNDISRREFVMLAAGSVLVPRTAPGTLTAREVVERIRQNIGVEEKPDTVDTFKAGNPDTVVKGIVTTAMPTIDVLRQAVKRGANFVITSEPTFYSKSDASSPPSGRGGQPAA